MKVIDFLRKKNELIFMATGLVLIPEDQLVDLPPRQLGTRDDASICPYCLVFMNDDMGDCYSCPMNKAFNKCTGWSDVEESNKDTYAEVKYFLSGDPILRIAGVHELVKKFNRENGFEEETETISEMNKNELLYFIELYNNYVVDFPDYHDSGSYPVCIYEFFECEYQQILEDDKKNQEESQ